MDPLLNKALNEWQVREPLPPRFAERVWQRVARAEAERQWPWWLNWVSWVNLALARPAMAGAYVAMLLMAGLLAGYWHAQVDNRHAFRQLETRYVQMLDPYQMPRQ